MNDIRYLLASSVAAYFEGDQRYGLIPTIEIAKEIGADGCQLYINPRRFDEGVESISSVKRFLNEARFKVNIAHLPGYLTPEDLEGQSFAALKIAINLIEPIEKIGKLCVIHHNPASPASLKKIVESAKSALERIGDRSVVYGLEHYHPPEITNNRNLSAQVDRFLNLLRLLQRESIPAIPVFDIGRFWTCNAQEPLKDEGDKLLIRMCEATSGQSVLIHAADFKRSDLRPVHPDNATRIGTGLMAPKYKKMVELGKEYDIRWVAVVDESEIQTVATPEETRQVKKLFSG